MILGNVILAVTSFVMFHVTHLLPEGARFIFFIVVACVYYLGYTCQCVVTKSAQSCLANDPKQRPLFVSFDAVYNTVLFAGLAIVAANLAATYESVGGYTSTEFFHTMWLFTAIASGVCTVLAVIAISPKDRSEFFGTGKPIKVGLKDYWDTLKNNRAIQMLVLSASADKLASSAKTGAVNVAMFACIAGSTLLQGNVTALTTIPTCIATFLAISLLATRLGQKKAMVIGSVGGIITNLALGALWLFGDPTTMTSNPATGAFHWGYFLILHLVLTIIQGGFQGISGNIVIPMTAGLVFAACGFTDHNPVMGDVATPQLRLGVVFLAYGIIILGLICNLIAMKFYPLTKEKMAELQNEIVAIKERTMAENQA